MDRACSVGPDICQCPHTCTAQHPQTYYPEVVMALQARRGAQAAAARPRTGSGAHWPAAVTVRVPLHSGVAPAACSVTGAGSLSHGARHRLRVRPVRPVSLRLWVASRPLGHPTHALLVVDVNPRALNPRPALACQLSGGRLSCRPISTFMARGRQCRLTTFFFTLAAAAVRSVLPYLTSS